MASESPVSLHSVSGDSLQSDPICLPSSDSEEDILLPDTTLGLECCKMNCLQSIYEDINLKTRADELKAGLSEQESSKDDLDRLRYDVMRTWQLEGKSRSSTWRRFQAWGVQALCSKALCHLLNMGSTVYSKFCKHLAEGFRDPPVDLRHTQQQRRVASSHDPNPARLEADMLLAWVYDHMAEDLAESDDFVKAKKTLAESRSYVLDHTQGPRRVRWLAPHTSLAEMREMALAFNPNTPHPPSSATFSRVYHAKWQDWLKVRHEGQHAICSDCQRFKAWRKVATSKEDRDRVQAGFSQHIESMREDRRVDAEIARRARETASGQLIDPDLSVISMVIDGMDTGKFKLPRCVDMSKEMVNLWRPEARFFGCLVEGVTEHFFLADCDMVKDSNWDLTLVSHCLHLTQQELQKRNVNLPQTLRLHADNCSAELKNQICFKWCSWLTHRGLFREVVVSTFRVGHSHNKIDQRFSEVRNVLNDSGLLECQDDFIEAIQAKLKPREGRSLNVDKLEASVEFQGFFEPLEVSASGHTQAKAKTERGRKLCIASLSSCARTWTLGPLNPVSQMKPTTMMSSCRASIIWVPKRIRSCQLCLLHTVILNNSILRGLVA